MILLFLFTSTILCPQPRTCSCRSGNNSQNITLRSPVELGMGNFDCTYACFSSRRSKIRAGDEIFAAPLAAVDAWPRTALFAYAIATINFIPYCIRYSAYGSSTEAQRAETLSSVVFGHFKVSGELFTPRVVCKLAAVVVIVVGGLFLFSDEHMFKTEEYFSIGQWSAPVSVFLVLFVALLGRHIIQRLRKLQISELNRILL